MTANPKAFKHGLGEDAVRRIARNIKVVEPSFENEAFVLTATTGLEALELKARVKHIVVALRRHLSDDEREAIDTLVRAGGSWDAGNPESTTDGFAAWPIIEFIGQYGLEHFDVSMAALRKLTSLFSSEFAIRGFLERYQARALALLKNWTEDPDPHVRRLISEGTRPRLPWGLRLRKFQDDPLPILELLEKLKDDEAEYVRRSVANNLNDIAKDNPKVVIDLCRQWMKQASAERRWIVKRATRSLVKEGNPAALALLGFDPGAKIVVEAFSLLPRELNLGEELRFTFEIRSRSDRPQSLAIDFAVHHVKRSGNRTPKVFKLRALELSPRGTVSIAKTHRIRKITTRAYYPGRHALEILVNGKSYAVEEFDLNI